MTVLPWLLTLITDVLKIAVGVGLSAMAAIYIVNKNKSRTDYVEKRIDDLCTEIRAVADLAADYWVKPPGNDLKVPEARIASRHKQIEEMRRQIGTAASELLSKEVDDASGEFFRCLTGGDFGVHNRGADTERARGAVYSGARFVTAIRKMRSDVHIRR